MENVVVVVKSVRPDYGALPAAVPAPELAGGEARTVAQLAIRELLHLWGFDAARFGTPDWNPLGEVMAPNSRLVLKPNWVVHENQSGYGVDCLVTHTTVIEAVLHYVKLAKPREVVIGDAPLQRCDFEKLQRACGLGDLVERFRRQELDVRVCDFRRTVMAGERRIKHEDVRPSTGFIFFDLKNESLLEPLSPAKFRVTAYNPELLESAHSQGRHRYLIAREIVDSDVVINLPKLKCHKKSCVTGALKNLIGINGNKEFLPHHRMGGSGDGGDCYSGHSWLKRRAEAFLDEMNRRPPGSAQRLLGRLAGATSRCAEWLGADDNLEGSWYGNDTIWRTCLDLQRILRYGARNGTLSDLPQRRVITITDAIIAGEGEGPLAPIPIGAGFVSGAMNPAAAEWVHARLMGFDPEKIPLVRNSLARFSHPLAQFRPEDVRVRVPGGERRVSDVYPAAGRAFVPPKGWRGHCELEETNDRTACEPHLVA